MDPRNGESRPQLLMRVHGEPRQRSMLLFLWLDLISLPPPPLHPLLLLPLPSQLALREAQQQEHALLHRLLLFPLEARFPWWCALGGEWK